MAHKITITLADFSKEGGAWNQPAVALVTDHQKRPQSGVDVQFYVDFQPYENPIETGDDGRAPIVFTGLTQGKHVFEAMEAGTATKSAPQTKTIKDDTKAESKLTYKQCGRKGNYFVLFMLVDKGKPVGAGKTITVTDLGGEGTKDPVITEEDGTVKWNVPDFNRTTQKDYLAVSLDPPCRCTVRVFQPEEEEEAVEEVTT